MSPKSAKQDDRLMTLSELGDYLHVSKKTVLKLATDEKIPGVMIEKAWRFKRDDIDDWLEEKLSFDSETDEELEALPDGLEFPLGDLMPIEALIHDMQATDSLTAIEELAARAYSNRWLNDKPWFIGALVEREALSSTAMEGGVAFLHTRARDTSKLKRPFVVCGRSYDGIEFGAPDGKPTYLFFLLGLKHDKLHLPILGRLARLTMRNPTIINRLRATTSQGKMRDILLKYDAQELTSMPTQVGFRGRGPTEVDRNDRLRQIMKVSAKKKFAAKKNAEEERKAAAKEERKRERAENAESNALKAATKATKEATAKVRKKAVKKTAAKKPAARRSAPKRKAPTKTK